MSAPRPPLHTEFPLAEADLCVKCGLCLPSCPTYLDRQHEGDSPRGRITLMQGLASGMVPLGASLEQHLDGCLGCRACERVCPAKVPYGRLIDSGRALLAQLRPERTRADRLIAFLLVNRPARRLLRLALSVYQRSGLQALLRRLRLLGTGKLARFESLLPPLATASPLPAARPRPTRGQVSLFTGCAGELFDARTLADTRMLLERIGFEVIVPNAQGCCGAIHQHAGERAQAATLARANLDAFAGDAPVLCSASGCGATLLDYPDLAPGEGARQFRLRVGDIHAFLLRHWPADLELSPLPLRIAVHEPCTLKNVMGGGAAMETLLRKIPGAEIVALDAQQHCCGAAGTHFMTQPQSADRLLQRKLDASLKLNPDVIASANIGCSLHLGAGLRRAGLREPEVLHPVSLLARQLRG